MDLTAGGAGFNLRAEDDAVPMLNIPDVPEDLYAELQALAARDLCSVDQEALRLLSAAVEPAPTGSILELKGLGKEIWDGIDAVTYVEEERGAWK